MSPKLPDAIKNIPFQEAVETVFETKVFEFKSEEETRISLLPLLEDAISEMCSHLRDNPITHTRVNEIGNMLEPFVVNFLNKLGIEATPAKTRAGKGQATAYPDVSFEFEGHYFYLEVKSFAAASINSKLRSFYMSPSDDPKVHKDAFHLVVGFEMLDQGPTGETRPGSDGNSKALHAYIPQAFEIADLYGMLCDMKAEFNSNNVRMYEADRMLVSRRLD